MKRRRGITEDKLNQVIKLREAGANWLTIQKETEIPRRSVKLAYEKWQKSKSVTELKTARINAATEIFKDHIQALIHFARYLATELTIPSSTWVSANEFLEMLLSNEITGQQAFYDLPQTNDRHRSKSILRHNQLLFKSLQDHTRGKIHWEALDTWRNAWDKCIELFGGIRKETSDFVDKEFKSKKLLQSIKENSGNQDAVARIVDTIFDTMRQYIMEDNLKTDEQVVEITSDNVLSTHIITSRGSSKAILTFTDGALAKKVSGIFDTVDTQVRMLHILAGNKAINDEINRMQTVIKELDEILSPIILYPILLSTRCDFCPV